MYPAAFFTTFNFAISDSINMRELIIVNKLINIQDVAWPKYFVKKIKLKQSARKNIFAC